MLHCHAIQTIIESASRNESRAASKGGIVSNARRGSAPGGTDAIGIPSSFQATQGTGHWNCVSLLGSPRTDPCGEATSQQAPDETRIAASPSKRSEMTVWSSYHPTRPPSLLPDHCPLLAGGEAAFHAVSPSVMRLTTPIRKIHADEKTLECPGLATTRRQSRLLTMPEVASTPDLWVRMSGI